MTTYQNPQHFSLLRPHLSTTRAAARVDTASAPPSPLRRIGRAVISFAAGFDAAARVAHGSSPGAEHPARRGRAPRN